MSNRGIMGKLRARFASTPGLVLYARDLADEFGVDVRVIQVTMANIRREHPGDGIVVHIPAQAWVFQPDNVPNGSSRMFEQLAVTKSGELIVQDEQGVLYRAAEL